MRSRLPCQILLRLVQGRVWVQKTEHFSKFLTAFQNMNASYRHRLHDFYEIFRDCDARRITGNIVHIMGTVDHPVNRQGSKAVTCKSPSRPHSNVALSVFTARCYASAVLAMDLCLSVTSRSSTKTAERIGLVFGM